MTNQGRRSQHTALPRKTGLKFPADQTGVDTCRLSRDKRPVRIAGGRSRTLLDLADMMRRCLPQAALPLKAGFRLPVDKSRR